ncbi:MAG: TetR/AcrR family transcriptional regulator [Aureispira sp.]|nr:TetR/AcrR family transcriptional regulator [Aureispira sp.]
MPRPKSFDEGVVLQKAVELFWKQGYNTTSMQNLVDHLGINRASIYDTYGGKEELFHKAFEHYRQENQQKLRAFLDSQSSVRKGLEKLFMMSINTCVADKDRKGCFVVNCATESLPNNAKMVKILSSNQESMEQFFMDYVNRGKKQGEITENKDAKAIAAFLFTLYSGLNVIAKVNPTTEHLQQVVQTGLAVLD